MSSPKHAAQWFWCLDHKTVEQDLGCGSTSRIGPCATREEAASALNRTHQREEEQRARDEADEKKYGKKRGWF
jgi:hypothetical protein